MFPVLGSVLPLSILSLLFCFYKLFYSVRFFSPLSLEPNPTHLLTGSVRPASSRTVNMVIWCYDISMLPLLFYISWPVLNAVISLFNGRCGPAASVELHDIQRGIVQHVDARQGERKRIDQTKLPPIIHKDRGQTAWYRKSDTGSTSDTHTKLFSAGQHLMVLAVRVTHTHHRLLH